MYCNNLSYFVAYVVVGRKSKLREDKMQGELTVIAAARLLGVTLDTVYRSIYAGRLPARKQAGKWQIPSSAVETRLKARGGPDGTSSR